MPLDPEEVERWLREDIDESFGTLLGQGYQATVHRYDAPFGKIVVKRPHTGLLGYFARRAIRHEHQIYKRLRGVPGVPQVYALIDDAELVLESVEGLSYRAQQTRLEDRDAFFAALLETLDAMHAAGVAHGDLKRKDNLLVGANSQPYLIDFGVGCWVDATTRGWRRWRFEALQQLDYNAWVKLKYGRGAPGISAADANRYRPLLLEHLARWIRVPWQKLTFRRPRQRLRRWLNR